MKRAFKIFLYLFKGYFWITGVLGIVLFIQNFFDLHIEYNSWLVMILFFPLLIAAIFEFTYISSSVSTWHAHPTTIAFIFIPHSILPFFAAVSHTKFIMRFDVPKEIAIILFILFLLLFYFFTNLRILIRHPDIFSKNKNPLFKDDKE